MVQVSPIPQEKRVLVLLDRMVPWPQEPWEPIELFLSWRARLQEFARKRVVRAAAQSVEEVQGFC